MILGIICQEIGWAIDCSDDKDDDGDININSGSDTCLHILVFILTKLLSKCLGLWFVR